MKPRRPRTGSIYLRGETYWIKYYRHGQAFRESAETDSYQEAERLLKKRQGDVVTGKFPGLEPERILMKQLSDAVVEDYRLNDRLSMGHVEHRLKLHLIPGLGDVRAAELGTAHIEKYKNHRRGSGASNASINREPAILKTSVPSCGGQWPSEGGATTWHHDAQEEQCSSGRFGTRFVWATPRRIATGEPVVVHNRLPRRLLRPTVDLRTKRIMLPVGTAKNKEGRTLPIYGEMLDWLKMAREIRDAERPSAMRYFRGVGRR